MVKNIRSMDRFKLENKIVVVRSNLDIPIENNEIIDQISIKAASETIKYLIQKNCKVIVVGHLGDPKGQYSDALSLMPVRFALGNALGISVKFADIMHCENSIKFMEFGEVLMLENLKFNTEEESDDSSTRIAFIKKLADLGDYYVNDDFATDKILASTYELPKLMKSSAGLQVHEEVGKLEDFKKFKAQNYTVVLGGKFKDIKLKLIMKNIENINNILIGGELAYDFFAAQGLTVKDYTIDKERINLIKEIIKLAKANSVNLVLPKDHVVTEGKTEKISKNISKGSDIGIESITEFNSIIEKSDKILVHGPMGEYKVNGFDEGSRQILEAIVFNTPKEAMTFTCGKAMLNVIAKFKIKSKRFTHISTSGDLMLNFLGGEKNPNLELLQA